MKSVKLLCFVIIALSLIQLSAKDKPHQAKNKVDTKVVVHAPAPTVLATATMPSHGKEPWLHVDVKLGGKEREIIQTYAVQQHKTKNLPPGLAKKVARGGQLPPGWQKKMAVGQVMPKEVYAASHPLPREVLVKLPSPPKGTITVVVEGKVVRLLEATREILDVFDVKL